MIRVIDITETAREPVPEGQLRTVLGPSRGGTLVEVAVVEVARGRTWRLARSEKTQVAYLSEGEDASLSHTVAGGTTVHEVGRGAGVCLEPGEEAALSASSTPLTLLLVTVPKYTGKPGAEPSPTGYVFEEAKLRALIDEKRIRERTFWVNKETGLSGGWDLQLGRMQYAPHGHSPRHVHRASTTGIATPEHFYLIEKGTGEVKHDGGSLPVGPGALVLIPAGEWHQLVASETGFDYIEFQAPFDFVTTMDHDPLGKNWYIKGSDDGTGKPELWVQS
jgi:mannose-6-phosphate isomerase-like protein (cupin superfamily)